ncbi:MAG: hybrid sensor histidine kinase/response regulator [Burkholderiales bacterium]|nr:hybrid sensor histidine kinase/response regulator [Burkholderiales bacterium]
MRRVASPPEVHAELLQVVLANMRTVSALGVFVALPIACVLLWSTAPRDALVVWAAAVALCEAAIWATEHRRRREAPGDRVNPRWETRYRWLLCLDGCAWGLSGWIFLPAAAGQELIVLMLLALLAASAAVQMGPVPSLYARFLGGLLTPLVLGLCLQADWHRLVMAFATVLTGAVMMSCARVIHRSLARTVETSIRNRELVVEVEQRRREAEHASEAKTRFFAAASHDLRQPVHAMALLTEVLLNDSPAGPQRATATVLHRSAQALQTLIGSLLDLSQLDAGPLEADRCPVPLDPLFALLHAEFQPEARARGITMRHVRCRLAVDADPRMLERILRNLLSNALQYTASGRVLLGARRRSGAASIQIWDTGIGIAPDHQRLIFDEFYQVSNPNRDRTRGLGLGLSIVQRLAHRMGATVELRSTPDRGSMFAVTLPRVPLPARPPTPEQHPADADRLRGGLVMVIDDDETTRVAMSALLRSWGAQVACAAGHEDAMARLRSIARVPDLILCDRCLGGERDGEDLIDDLRQEFAESIPAVLITAHAGTTTAPDTGACRVLVKPVKAAELLTAIGECLPPRASTGLGRRVARDPA